jgi:hypothetical protein
VALADTEAPAMKLPEKVVVGYRTYRIAELSPD